MAGYTSKLLKVFLAISSHGALSLTAAKPGLEILGLHDHDFTNHGRMLGAAILGAKQVIGSRLCRFKPNRVVAIGKHVVLYPESRNKEAMDDVLGDHRNLHRPPRGHVKRIDFTLAAGIFELPHPLLAYAVEFQGIGGRAALMEINRSGPTEDDHRDAQRYNGPDNLQQGRAMNLLRFAVWGALVLDGEK